MAKIRLQSLVNQKLQAEFDFMKPEIDENYVSPLEIGQTHNSRFAYWEDRYKHTRSDSDFVEMWKVCFEICTNFVTDYEKKSGFSFDADVKIDRIEDSVVEVLAVIQKNLLAGNENYRVGKLSCLAWQAVRKTLSADKNPSKVVSWEEITECGMTSKLNGI